jgi:hypothetical protein
MELTKQQEIALQEYFSNKGKLLYYYSTKIGLQRLTSPKLKEYYSRVEQNASEKDKGKARILNVSYSDPTIVASLIKQQKMEIEGLTIYTTEFSKNKPSKKDIKGIKDYNKFYKNVYQQNKKVLKKHSDHQ